MAQLLCGLWVSCTAVLYWLVYRWVWSQLGPQEAADAPEERGGPADRASGPGSGSRVAVPGLTTAALHHAPGGSIMHLVGPSWVHHATGGKTVYGPLAMTEEKGVIIIERMLIAMSSIN